MRILAFSPIKADGTSFYRGFGPLNHLQRKDQGIHITNGSVESMEISWDVIYQHDLLFFQRPSIFTDINIMEMAKRCNRPIVIDYDDDYFNILPSNPRAVQYGTHRLQQIRRAIELADHIFVSTLAIKESIVENTGKNRDQIQVIPNGVDETIFDLTWQNNLSLRNTVLWRGGDTHNEDIAAYLDKMIELYNEFPKLKWAFMGHAPQDLLEKIDTSRIILYPFDDITVYFDRLFELRPLVTIVPWAENKFNIAKSNCVWLESTLAGAPTIFPRWSTEFVEGMVGYQDPESFGKAVQSMLYDSEARQREYNRSHTTLCKRFTLEAMNRARIDIFHNLIVSNPMGSKIGVKHPKYTMEVEPFTDKQFFDYTWEKQFNQDFDHYREAHGRVAEWLYETFKPNTVVELGCGPGPYVEKFCDLKVPQVAGFELNPYFQDYFIKRNPHYSHAFLLGDFLEADLSGVFDLCVCVEVFEHIPHEKLMPFIERMADHFKVLYFSSTPYKSSQSFDRQWSHVNLKTFEAWVALFEANGFAFVERPNKATIWDMLLVSTRINKATEVALKAEHLEQ